MQQTINDANLYKAIAISFEEDEELLKHYHVVETQVFEDCVNDTYDKIIEATQTLPLEWYIIKTDDHKTIGFCVLSRAYNFLYSFGINKQYRNSNTLSTWFVGITEILQNNFVCGLWAKNKRAIDFLCKNGMKIFKEKDNIIQLKYN